MTFQSSHMIEVRERNIYLVLKKLKKNHQPASGVMYPWRAWLWKKAKFLLHPHNINKKSFNVEVQSADHVQFQF